MASTLLCMQARVYTHSCPRATLSRRCIRKSRRCSVFARVIRETYIGRYADAIVLALELIREVDTAIGILDEFLAVDLFCKSRQIKFRLRSEIRRQYHYMYIGPLYM